MKCKKCGYENAQSSEFCAKCGEKLSNKDKKKKTFIILGVILGIIVIVISYFVIVRLINKFDDPFESVDELSKMEDNTINNDIDYKDITCYFQLEESIEDEFNAYVQIKVLFDDQDKINDLYFKGTVQMKNYDPDDFTFKITKKILTTVLNGMKRSYQEDFKKYKFMTIDDKDKLSVLFRITDGYYEAINNNLSTMAESKDDILNALKNEGYTCSIK